MENSRDLLGLVEFPQRPSSLAPAPGRVRSVWARRSTGSAMGLMTSAVSALVRPVTIRPGVVRPRHPPVRLSPGHLTRPGNPAGIRRRSSLPPCEKERGRSGLRGNLWQPPAARIFPEGRIYPANGTSGTGARYGAPTGARHPAAPQLYGPAPGPGPDRAKPTSCGTSCGPGLASAWLPFPAVASCAPARPVLVIVGRFTCYNVYFDPR